MDFVRIWMHEATRVYRDKLIDPKDMENYEKMLFECAKGTFDVSPSEIVCMYVLLCLARSECTCKLTLISRRIAAPSTPHRMTITSQAQGVYTPPEPGNEAMIIIASYTP